MLSFPPCAFAWPMRVRQAWLRAGSVAGRGRVRRVCSICSGERSRVRPSEARR